MKLLKTRTLCLALAALGLSTLGASAQPGADNGEFMLAANNATNPGYCNAYAKRAVNAHKQNQRNRCRFRGARWHGNYDRHYQWCLRVPKNRAESESKGRQQQLKTCKQRSSGGTNEGYCNAYAKRAVNAQKQNQRNRCGFRGARWNGNYDRHYQWCLRVPKSTAESESKGRQQQLQSCK